MSSSLEDLIGISFTNKYLLQSALVHRSFLHEHPEQIPNLSSNERLEFLGDAVLNFITASWLYTHFPELTEGKLTHMRAALVKTATLADFARRLDLGSHIRISRGEDTPVARNRATLLADVFEAILGAIFLDQGLEAARAFVTPFLEQRIAAILSGEVEIDYRTSLQELAQSLFNRTPIYRTLDVRGPDHQREFTMEVLIGDQSYGVGSGASKQAAAQAAAQAALGQLRERS